MLKKDMFIPDSFLREVSRFIRFAGVGAVGTLAQYLTLTALVEFLAIDVVHASAVGFTLGAFVNYFLNYHYTFRSKKRHSEAIFKFFSMALIGRILNTVIMSVMTNYLGFHYLLAQIISTGLVLLWNFSGNRLWTFREAQGADKR